MPGNCRHSAGVPQECLADCAGASIESAVTLERRSADRAGATLRGREPPERDAYQRWRGAPREGCRADTRGCLSA
eukprot:10066822-Alexandrium_andersonii.AAC.1